jgi:hypothetical protein
MQAKVPEVNAGMDSEWESMLEEDKARKASVGVPSSQM